MTNPPGPFWRDKGIALSRPLSPRSHPNIITHIRLWEPSTPSPTISSVAFLGAMTPNKNQSQGFGVEDLSHHSRFHVTCECDEREINDDDNDDDGGGFGVQGQLAWVT